jgi:hypothetical protein
MLQAHHELCRVIKKYVVSLTLAPLLVVGSARAGEPALRLFDSVEIPVSPMNPLAGTLQAGTYSYVAQGAAALDVIDALSQTLDQRVPTLNVPAAPGGSHPAGTAHSVAAYSGTNHVFVPIAANNAVPSCLTGCITIYGSDDPAAPSN